MEIAKNVKPSERGELEITSVNQEYLTQKNLKIRILQRGFAWLDTGTHDSLYEAGNFIETVGLQVACLEEIAFGQGWISKEKLVALGMSMKKNNYGKYLLNVAQSRD